MTARFAPTNGSRPGSDEPDGAEVVESLGFARRLARLLPAAPASDERSALAGRPGRRPPRASGVPSARGRRPSRGVSTRPPSTHSSWSSGCAVSYCRPPEIRIGRPSTMGAGRSSRRGRSSRPYLAAPGRASSRRGRSSRPRAGRASPPRYPPLVGRESSRARAGRLSSRRGPVPDGRCSSRRGRSSRSLSGRAWSDRPAPDEPQPPEPRLGAPPARAGGRPPSDRRPELEPSLRPRLGATPLVELPSPRAGRLLEGFWPAGRRGRDGGCGAIWIIHSKSERTGELTDPRVASSANQQQKCKRGARRPLE